MRFYVVLDTPDMLGVLIGHRETKKSAVSLLNRTISENPGVLTACVDTKTGRLIDAQGKRSPW